MLLHKIMLCLAAAGALCGCAPARPAPVVAPGAGLTMIHKGNRFYEAPVWEPVAGVLYFDAYKKVDMLVRHDGPGLVVPMAATKGVGGAFLTMDGRILGADCTHHRIVSYAPGSDGLGDMKVLAADEKWHQPNDICQSPTGDIYFTDPDFANKADGGVYHLSPDGTVTKVVGDLPCPNGIISSNDGKTIYVSDSDLKRWYSYPVLAGGLLGKGKIFFNPDVDSTRSPDGMTIDSGGNLYFTGLGGVWVVDRNGKMVDFIQVTQFCSNVTFGGPDNNILYITCGRRVYSLQMTARGGRGASGRHGIPAGGFKDK